MTITRVLSLKEIILSTLNTTSTKPLSIVYSVFLIALTLCFGLTLNRPEFSVLAFIGTMATFLSWNFIFSQYKLIIDLVRTLLDNVVKCFYFVFLVLCGLYLLICGYFNGEDL